MTEEIKVSNLAKYRRYLENLIGEEKTSLLFDVLGGEEAVMNASFGMTLDSGSAYEGAFVKNSLEIADYASKLNKLLPEELQVTNASIYKVALLHHIGKILMYEKNANDWEVKNRGIIYKFKDEDKNALRCGEVSLYYLNQVGVQFTLDEFEAMRVIDKVNAGDDSIRWYGSILSTLIRQANETVSLINQKV